MRESLYTNDEFNGLMTIEVRIRRSGSALAGHGLRWKGWKCKVA